MRREAGGDRSDGSRGGAGKPAPRKTLSRETLEAARRRDPDALGELYDHCFGQVYSLAYRLTGDHAAAQDVSQDVFLKVHGALPQLDPSRPIGPWLAAITHNACRERWRSRGYRLFSRARTLNGVGGESGALRNGKADPERSTQESERDRLVMDAIMKLPEAMRVVVLLHDYQGIPHEEIAEWTRTGHAAVRKRYSRALARLREELKGVLE